MDMNGHINNVNYLAWALETVPQEVYGSCLLKWVCGASAAGCCAWGVLAGWVDGWMGGPLAAAATGCMHAAHRHPIHGHQYLQPRQRNQPACCTARTPSHTPSRPPRILAPRLLTSRPRPTPHPRRREITLDFKNECKAGNTVESLAAQQPAADGSDASMRLLHTLRRCDDAGCVELVRATSKWVPV
jgi:hypothetical protein